MGKIFAVPIASTASAIAHDWVEVRAAASRKVTLVTIEISQSTEIGDAMEEMIRWNILIGEGSVTAGNGGAVTPRPVDSGGASGFSARANSTTRLAVGTGTLYTIAMAPFNVRTGLFHCPVPEARWSVLNQNYLAVGCIAPVDSVTWEGVAYFEED